MSGFREICLVVVLVSISPALIRGDDLRPALKLTYEVRYNTSSARVSQDCGRQYASEFLERFIQVEGELSSLCRQIPQSDSRRAPSPTIQVYVLAKVTILAAQEFMQNPIVLDTYLNISNTGGARDQARRGIEYCASRLNRTFSDVTRVPWLRDGMTRIAEEGNCSEAQMHPERLDFSAQVWECQENFTFDEDRWRCVPNGPPPSTPPVFQPTSGALATTSESDEEEDDDDTCRLDCIKQLKNVVGRREFCRLKFSQTIPCVEQAHGDEDDAREVCLDAIHNLQILHGRQCHNEEQTPTTTTTDTGTTPSTESVTTSAGDSSSTSSFLTEPRGETEPAPTSPVYTTAPYTAEPRPDDWGIQIKDNRSLIELEEGGRGDRLVFRPWANVSRLCGGAADCTLSVRLFFIEDARPRCRSTNRSIAQVVLGEHGLGTDFCSVTLDAGTLGRDVVVPLHAKLDGKYDGLQVRSFTLLLVKTIAGEITMETWNDHIPVVVSDGDRKATCQSINDPHITTFDGFEYNNYYHGEFVLYNHKDLPFKVHAVYQRCEKDFFASCNCAVAVQSDDDVIVIDRCRRKRKPVKRLEGEVREVSIMSVTLYLNGELTQGTRIFQEADGKKYFIYLPTGTYIKVLVSGDLVNVWVVGSPNDFAKTKGLCGNYTADITDDLLFPDGTVLPNPSPQRGPRPQPRDFVKAWQVDISGPDSLLDGVPASEDNYQPKQYCECNETGAKCGYGMDIETCDTYQGTDVTKFFVENAEAPKQVRKRRSVEEDNTINAIDEPIDMDPTREPPDYHWNSIDAEEDARWFCKQYLVEGELGRLCAQVPGVNIQQEVTTCVEDIQITGNTSWASSARDALKEQCWEQIRRNGSLPQDMVDQLANFTCVNSCSQHGVCSRGLCRCDEGFTTSDCSTSTARPPYVSRMPEYGLCDIHIMNCSRVIVYGQDFINTQNLTCHLEETDVEVRPYRRLQQVVTEPASFINFNAVECPIPDPSKSYFIAVSNDGQHTSDPLLFIPVDSKCRRCNVSNPSCYTFDTKFCSMDSRCYSEGQVSETDACLRCERTGVGGDGQWVTVEGTSCRGGMTFQDWQIAVIAAIAGSIIGLLVGLLLYWCCCMSRKGSDPHDYPMDRPVDPETTIFDDTRLHRNCNLDVFQNPDTFNSLVPPERPNREYEETFFHNNGQGVENGVDDTTYF